MGKFLGIDASTQSMTALIIDTGTEEINAEESITFDAHFKAAYGIENGVWNLGKGEVHSSPLMWAEALEVLLQALRDKGCDLGAIDAISGSGQQHGTVYLNHRAAGVLANLDPGRSVASQVECIFSRPTAPVWMDTSTTTQCREIEARLGGRQALLELSGNTAFERFSAPQIRKFFQTDPTAYEGTACIGLISSYMASLLAGCLVGVDPGDGSGTNMMNIRTRRWSPWALAATAAGLERRLLPIVASTKIVGCISPYFVERYGFDPGCKILPFSGDNPCSLIGLGLVEPGRVALSLGTSDTLFACMESPRTSEEGEGAVFASPDGTNYMALICFLNGSLAREAVRQAYGLDWEGFTRALRTTSPGNGGALILPYFSAEIVPRVSEPGVVREDLDVADVRANVRAIIEAQAMSSQIHSRWMGLAIKSLYVTGGASSNPEILQVFANVHNCPVHRFETTNSAALGAALRASFSHQQAGGRKKSWREIVGPFTEPVRGSTIEPDAAAAAVYARLIPRYRALEKRHIG